MESKMEMPPALRDASLKYYEAIIKCRDPLINMSSVGSFLSLFILHLDLAHQKLFKTLIAKLFSIQGAFEVVEVYISTLGEVLGVPDERI